MAKRISSRIDAFRAMQQVRRDERQVREGRITVAGKKRKKKAEQRAILQGEARRALIHEVIDTMKAWSFSHFEHEATCRHGLRASLCLQGHDWHLSDNEAIGIVQEALRAMGAQRPSWMEGQWAYTVGRDQCVRCGGPIDDEGQGRGHRFCSNVCAKGSMVERAANEVYTRDRVYIWAQQMIWLSRRKAKPCAQCGTMFKSLNPKVVYCSPRCVRHSAGGLLEDRQCLWCGETFHPRDHSMECCSKPCASKHRHREWKQQAEERSCTVCRSVFRPKTSSSIYCSPVCARTARNTQTRQQRAEVTQARLQEVKECVWCGSPFSGRGPTAQCCSKNCAVYYSRMKAGKNIPKRLSPPVFDYVFRQAA